jgi:hypothetical protein
VEGAEVEELDINDYEMPIFSPEHEEQLGQPQQAKDFSKNWAKQMPFLFLLQSITVHIQPPLKTCLIGHHVST